jgi:hypothetical protein
VPDRRTHRGPHPEDVRLFAPEFNTKLSQAVGDLCWLLTRGYAPDSSLKLVGDRHGLVARQRVAVARCSCSESDANRRRSHEVHAESLHNRKLLLDGYNVLTTIEAALAGGVILSARDGTFRDMASMHGSYRKVSETRPALLLIGEVLQTLRVAQCCWYLDRPVSNSGRLKTIIEQMAAERCWPWQAVLADDVDALLVQSSVVVASADSGVLGRCGRWCNLAYEVIQRRVPTANIVPMGGLR